MTINRHSMKLLECQPSLVRTLHFNLQGLSAILGIEMGHSTVTTATPRRARPQCKVIFSVDSRGKIQAITSLVHALSTAKMPQQNFQERVS